MDDKEKQAMEAAWKKRVGFVPHTDCNCDECDTFLTGWNVGFSHAHNAASAYHAGNAGDGWIDVNDRWPDVPGDYFWQDTTGNIDRDFYHPDFPTHVDYALQMHTAWRPLPAPYKRADGE